MVVMKHETLTAAFAVRHPPAPLRGRRVGIAAAVRIRVGVPHERRVVLNSVPRFADVEAWDLNLVALWALLPEREGGRENERGEEREEGRDNMSVSASDQVGACPDQARSW